MALSKQELFEVIRLIRPLLILSICVSHTPYIAGYLSAHAQYLDLGSLFPVFIKDFFARGGVPILSVISGYLAVYSFKKYRYADFVRHKFVRLMVPFIVWNVIALLLLSALSRNTGIADPHNVIDYIRAIFGLYRLPINLPTYFLRDLFLIMACLPLIHLLCKKPVLLLVALVPYLFFYWNQPSVGFYLGDLPIPLTFRTDTPLFFILGYFIALHNVNIPRFSGYASFVCVVFITAIGVFTSMLLAALKPPALFYVMGRALMGAAFVLIAPAIFYGLLRVRSQFIGRLLAWLSPYSFTLFLTHILSAKGFGYLIHHKLHWKVNETYSIWQQSLYIVSYLVFVTLAAIVIFKTWHYMIAKMKTLTSKPQPTA